MSNAVGRRALVVGAGMGGLVAARAVSERFEHVIVLERDELPATPTHRPGVPQGRHTHALLAGGERALSELFQGFENELIGAGAVACRTGLDTRIERPGFDPFPRRDLGWLIYASSRPLVEGVVRKRVEQLGNVEFRPQCRVDHLVEASDAASITGARCVNAQGRNEVIATDLVVDASGRGALTLASLANLGFPAPEETTIGVDFGYATAIFEMPDVTPAFKSLMVLPRIPESTRAALLYPLENRRWIVSMGGRYGDKPPGDSEGFFEFARGLRTPTLFETIHRAAPVGDIVRFGFAESVRRHFEKLSRFPRGLLPFADVICRFNPIYGQGMSVAAQEACLLRRVLERAGSEPDPGGALARTFFAELEPIIDAPWALAAVPDLAYPETRGQRPPDFETGLRFAAALLRLAAEDPAVHKLMMEVQHLLKPRSVYRDPVLQGRVAALMARS